MTATYVESDRADIGYLSVAGQEHATSVRQDVLMDHPYTVIVDYADYDGDVVIGFEIMYFSTDISNKPKRTTT